METEKQYFKNTSYACRFTLQSLFNKMERIKKYRQNVRENTEVVSSIDDKQWENDVRIGIIIENFSFFCESIYSCMDYLGYLIYIYQLRNGLDRGGQRTVPSSFHDIADAYSDQLIRKKYAIFKCHELCDVMSSIVQWYYDIRLIRSKEIHYNTGQIIKVNVKYFAHSKASINLR